MELKEALSKLDEQESIVDFFRDQQIHGVAGCAIACPVSNYLFEATGKRYIVCEEYIIDAGESAEMVMVDEFGSKIRNFISFFDDDVYPDLITSPPVTEGQAFELSQAKALQMAACLAESDHPV